MIIIETTPFDVNYINILNLKSRKEFRDWLQTNHKIQSECWVNVKRGKPCGDDFFWYVDAIEEALCFGWIDSKHKTILGNHMQRFSPRKPGSHWTELNKERVKRLKKLGLMTKSGFSVVPAETNFIMDPDVERQMKLSMCWEEFKKFPDLYKKIKIGNISFYKKRDPKIYKRMLFRLIEQTKKGKMFGEWNDYGRLLLY